MTEERWQHIMTEHPELEGLHQEVLMTVRTPQKVFAGNFGELVATKEIALGKFLVVIYKETEPDDGFVITAFLTRRANQLEKKVIVWPRR